MDELAGDGALGALAGGAFEVVEFPVTIACTGNRRGEVNSIKRSSGFSWGAAGVSTCVWRGVFVRDVVRACGLEVDLNHSGRYDAYLPRRVPRADTSRRLYLHYEGADILSEGAYATSVPLMHVLDPCNDVLLAFGRAWASICWRRSTDLHRKWTCASSRPRLPASKHHTWICGWALCEGTTTHATRTTFPSVDVFSPSG